VSEPIGKKRGVLKEGGLKTNRIEGDHQGTPFRQSHDIISCGGGRIQKNRNRVVLTNRKVKIDQQQKEGGEEEKMAGEKTRFHFICRYENRINGQKKWLPASGWL